MCIRDRINPLISANPSAKEIDIKVTGKDPTLLLKNLADIICLLYTSDAADERSSVDLGGRRIIKKKTCGTVGDSRQRHTSYTSIVHVLITTKKNNRERITRA